jgi:hypothetical protein
MNNQQDKAFKYIYSVADGYRRTLPLKNIVPNPTFNDYNRFYKDIREDLQPDFEWNKITELVSLFPKEVAAFGKTWYFNDIQNMVFNAYEQIWNENNITEYPSEYNIDIQMFDAYLLSPNCFTSVYRIIYYDKDKTDTENTIIAGEKCHEDPHRYNNIIKSAKMAYIRKITLPEWNTQDTISKKTQKEVWYDRISIIEQL